MLAIYINSGHTTGGNPKRGWIITNGNGEFVDFVDEGYSGHAALERAGYDCPSTGRLEVAPGVYREFKHDAELRAKQTKTNTPHWKRR